MEHLRDETLPKAQQVQYNYHVKVMRTYLQACVPLSKLNGFKEIREENRYGLCIRQHLFDLIPFI